MFYCFTLCIYGKMPRSVAKLIHYNFWFVYLVILHTFGVWKWLVEVVFSGSGQLYSVCEYT